MKSTLRNSLALGALALSLALAACSSGRAPAGGTSTLQGTVSSSQALRVAVPGTSLGTSTDAKGSFLLLRVPPGASSLRFTGPGVNATLPITSMLSQERRSIAVTVDASGAREHHEQSDDDFHGTVEAVTPPTLKVAGRTVTTTSDTKVTLSGSAAALSALSVGDLAEVEGALQADGSVLARSISAHPPRAGGVADDDGEDEHEGFVGQLTAKDDTTLTVSGVTVTTTSTTTYVKADAPIARDALAVGDLLLVRGTPTGEHAMTATQVRVIIPETEGEVHVSGAITALDAGAGTFSVGETALSTGASTEYGGAGEPHALGDFHVGDLVFVEAVHESSGGLLATSVHRYLPPPPPTTEIDAKGTITNLGVDGLNLGEHRFAFDAHTVVTKDGAAVGLSALANGQAVEVHALPRDQPLPPLATRIEIGSN